MSEAGVSEAAGAKAGTGTAAVGESGTRDAGAAGSPRSRNRHRAVFVGLAGTLVVADQLAKAWVVAHFTPGEPAGVVGEWIRIWYVANNGALFGMFRDQALLFAALSIGVMGLIVWWHDRAVTGSGWLATLALGLLLGGAVGNFIDRVRLGYVVDFVDMGFPGGWRFYTWNVADAGISTAIVLLLAMAVLPVGRREAEAG